MARSPAATVAQALLPWLLLAAPALAAANPELARDRRCLNCHTVERKLVGPAFRDVARRYAGRPEVLPRLADKVVKGGGGSWGPVPMSANPQVTPDEARRLVAWVLSLQ